MEHAKKMVLLPTESVERIQQQYQLENKLKSVQTPGTPISRLDAKMNDILYSNKDDEREKCLQYLQSLQRYLNLKEHDFKKTQVPKEDKIKESKNVAEEDSLDVASIAETVPKKYRMNATLLAQRLRDTNVVSWDKFGAVSIDGVQIRGGNIIDLINDTVRDRKREPPPGRRQFARALRQASIPQEFIGNKKVWREACETSSARSSTPTASSSSIAGTSFARANYTLPDITPPGVSAPSVVAARKRASESSDYESVSETPKLKRTNKKTPSTKWQRFRK